MRSSGGLGFVVTSLVMKCRSPTLPSEPKDVVKDLSPGLEPIIGWMTANKLKLNPNKTEVLLVGRNPNLDSGITPGYKFYCLFSLYYSFCQAVKMELF